MSNIQGILMRRKMSQANDDALLYSSITIAVSIIHFVYFVIFFAMHVYALSALDFVFFAVYVILSRIIPTSSKYNIFFIFIGLEIIINSSLVTLFIGWSYCFMYYLVGLIPIAFMVAFSIKSFEKQLNLPILITASVILACIIVRIITLNFNPLYSGFEPVFKYICSIINICLGCGCTFVFSTMFFEEVIYMQTNLEQEQQSLEDKAKYDPLTKLLNRRSFEERLNTVHKNAVINNTPYSLIMTDIDNFKHFNDTYGHDCGDYVLKTIAKIMSSQVRGNDYVCRWGGEEFLILVSDDMATARDVAERIRKNIDNYDFYYEGQSLHVSITLGVSSYYEGVKSKILIEIADKRLYKGKENGKNQVVCN